jgi:O-antigen/teichoic acid export membrane protein
LSSNLRANLFWDYLNRFASTILNLVTSIILARILSPGDFGIVGISMAVGAIGSIFLNLGFVNGIIQAKEIDETMLSTAFYINILLAIVLYFGIFFSSDWVSHYYALPDLSIILKFSAIAYIFNAMSFISYAQLNRAMKFKQIATVDIITAVLSGIIGIYLALNGFGIWSIVVQQLVSAFILFLCFYLITKWTPKLKFSLESIKPVFKFGKYLFLTNLVETIYSRFDILLIARVFNVNVLGFYTRAQGLELTIRSLSSSGLLVVLFPTFTKIREDLNLLRASYYKYFELIAFIFFFLVGFFYLGADQIFLILFGSKWNQSAIFFKIIILAAFSFPLCNLGVSIIQATGNSKSVFKLEVIKRIFQIPSYFIVYFYGITWFLISYIVLGFVNTFFNIYMVKKQIGISFKNVFIMLMKYLTPSMILILLIDSKYNFWKGNNFFLNTIIDILVFSIFYITINGVFRSKPFVFMLDLLKSQKK